MPSVWRLIRVGDPQDHPQDHPTTRIQKSQESSSIWQLAKLCAIRPQETHKMEASLCRTRPDGPTGTAG